MDTARRTRLECPGSRQRTGTARPDCDDSFIRFNNIAATGFYKRMIRVQSLANSSRRPHQISKVFFQFGLKLCKQCQPVSCRSCKPCQHPVLIYSLDFVGIHLRHCIPRETCPSLPSIKCPASLNPIIFVDRILFIGPRYN